MHNQVVLDWIEAVSEELKRFLNLKGLTTVQLAAILGVSSRDIQRVQIGVHSDDPRIVRTEIYAKLFFYCGIQSADPRLIPPTQGNPNRAWTQAYTEEWVLRQIDEMGTQIERLVDLVELIKGANMPFLDRFKPRHGLTIQRLREVVRILLLNPDDRLGEHEVN